MIFLLKISLFFLFLFNFTVAKLVRSCVETDVNYPGNDITMLPATPSTDHCHAYCVLTEGCQYFTFDYANRKCWLKNAKTIVLKNGGYNSGRRDCCSEAGYDYYFNDMSSIEAASPSECESICQKTPGCKYWSIYNKGGTCWLKTSDAGRYVNPGATSGVSDCPIKTSLPTNIIRRGPCTAITAAAEDPDLQKTTASLSYSAFETFDSLPSAQYNIYYSLFGLGWESDIRGTFYNFSVHDFNVAGGVGKTGKYALARGAETNGVSIVMSHTGSQGLNFFGYWWSSNGVGDDIAFYSNKQEIFRATGADLKKRVTDKNPNYLHNPNYPKPNHAAPFAFLSFYFYGCTFDEIKIGSYGDAWGEFDNPTVGYLIAQTAGTGYTTYRAEPFLVPDCLEDNIGYDLYDITVYTAADVGECHAYCLLTPGCKYWSLAKDGQWCWVKTSKAGRKPMSNRISGRVDCCTEPQGIDYGSKANLLQNTLATTKSSLKDCRSYCSANVNCTGFTYGYNNQCLPKYTFDFRQNNVQAPLWTSGVPNCPKQIPRDIIATGPCSTVIVTIEDPSVQNTKSKFTYSGTENFDWLTEPFYSSFLSLFGGSGTSGIQAIFYDVDIVAADIFGGADGRGKYARTNMNNYHAWMNLTKTGPQGLNYFGYYVTAIGPLDSLDFFSEGTKIFSFSASDIWNSISPSHKQNPNFPDYKKWPFAFVNFYFPGCTFSEVYYGKGTGGYEFDNVTVGKYSTISGTQVLGEKTTTTTTTPTITATITTITTKPTLPTTTKKAWESTAATSVGPKPDGAVGIVTGAASAGLWSLLTLLLQATL